MNRAIIERADGGISVIIPAAGYDAAQLATEQLEKTALFETITDDDGNFLRVDRTDTETLLAICNDDGTDPDDPVIYLIPPTRTYRDCWRKNKHGCAVDMTEARKVRVDELRAIRKIKWPAVDAARNRAVEHDDSVAMEKVKTDSKKMRDMPVDVLPDLDAITDPEELSVFIPVSLE
jgi:hypothetical protein